MDSTGDFMKWKICPLSELNYQEIYQLFKLRTEVFVVEQQCAYSEIDEDDLTCLHGMLFKTEKLIACFRIIQRENMTKIGRVIVIKEERGKGIASELMQVAINHCPANIPIQISAQAHLQPFYQECGFEVISDLFFEDGIPHVQMQYIN